MTSPVVTEFSKHAESYDKFAVVQKTAADLLIKMMNESQVEPSSNLIVLEIGAGTGILTSNLLEANPSSCFVCLDASSTMLRKLRKKLAPQVKDSQILTYLIDCNRLSEFMLDSEFNFDMVVSSFAIQWINDLPYLFRSINKLLRAGGRLAFCLPGQDSFPEWQEACSLAGVPYTANSLPSYEEVVNACSNAGFSGDFQQLSITQKFDKSRDFFHSLRQTGASKRHQRNPEPAPILNASQFSKLEKSWDSLFLNNQIEVSYQAIFAILEKN